MELTVLKFEESDRGGAIARLPGGKICLPRRGGPSPRADEVWLASHIEQRERSALATLKWRLNQVPGTWSEPNEAGRRTWVVTDPDAAAALSKAGIRPQPPLAGDVAINGRIYRAQAQKRLAERETFIDSKDGTVVEADYVCGGGFEGATVVFPRPNNAPPRGAVVVQPGDVVVRREFRSGIMTALKVVGRGELPNVGAWYDKDDDDWVHATGTTTVIKAEVFPIPDGLPGWFTPRGFCLVWDQQPQGEEFLGRCDSGAVVALSRFGRIRVSGFACADLYGKVDQVLAANAWGELSELEISPWERYQDGWVRRSAEVIVACVRPRPDRIGFEVMGPRLPFFDGYVALAACLIFVDEANGWKTEFKK